MITISFQSWSYASGFRCSMSNRIPKNSLTTGFFSEYALKTRTFLLLYIGFEGGWIEPINSLLVSPSSQHLSTSPTISGR